MTPNLSRKTTARHRVLEPLVLFALATLLLFSHSPSWAALPESTPIELLAKIASL